MELAKSIRAAKRVFIIGNGGSYANASHIVNDLVAAGVRAHTLDAATLTAIANDFGYENVFSRWLETLAEKGDLLIALSGSGRSPNILKACESAERIGMTVWREFGAVKGLNMQHSEELQLVIGHRIMKWLMEHP